MNKYNALISKINFRKGIIIYITAALIAGILSAAVLGITFKNNIKFAYDYHKINVMVNKNKNGVESIKNKLTDMANSSGNIKDILILDNSNKIIYSAKNSELAAEGSFDLTYSATGGLLTFKTNPDIYFKLINNDNHFILSKSLFDENTEVIKKLNDKLFYLNNFDKIKIYYLSYIISRTNGDKIYFISNIQKIPYGEISIKAVAGAAMLFFMIYWVAVSLWVYKNALSSKLFAPIWGIITLFTNLAGLLVYLIYKSSSQTCYKCGAVQNKSNKYCIFCGSKIARSCVNCDTAINDKDIYCKNCGNKL